ncbi:hypothetical protein HPB51_029464 [Rhipicephalus microplus]|uniref:Uncharacterized protein n=1 Tax=Rhipicephalus microplus TaxID=6941 RepID=A0A9J6CUH7_RHIMP|nr:hypothetical protein HPB51_029464 [Rhipicephalus microplus]
MIVNQRNPKAMEVHRIKETTTVVVLFSGLKVPTMLCVVRACYGVLCTGDRLTFVMDVELSAIVPKFARHRSRKCVAGVLSMIPRTITNASRHVFCAGGYI